MTEYRWSQGRRACEEDEQNGRAQLLFTWQREVVYQRSGDTKLPSRVVQSGKRENMLCPLSPSGRSHTMETARHITQTDSSQLNPERELYCMQTR